MSIVNILGSFPNSQIKPRPSSQEAAVNVVNLADGVETPILTPNPNRTQAFIKVRSGTVLVDYEAGPQDGVILETDSSLDISVTADTVYATAQGGAAVVEIDDREG